MHCIDITSLREIRQILKSPWAEVKTSHTFWVTNIKDEPKCVCVCVILPPQNVVCSHTRTQTNLHMVLIKYEYFYEKKWSFFDNESGLTAGNGLMETRLCPYSMDH